jgi:hypothetical protein
MLIFPPRQNVANFYAPSRGKRMKSPVSDLDLCVTGRFRLTKTCFRLQLR